MLTELYATALGWGVFKNLSNGAGEMTQMAKHLMPKCEFESLELM